MAGYIGTTPVPQATQHRESFTATGGQTSFATVGYTPQFIDVYLNGVKLAPADFTATNGSDVVLASGATASDILEIVAYTPFEIASQTFTGDTTANNFAVTGTFTSRGIDDNADAVAITIDSSENVGIGTSSPATLMHLSGTSEVIRIEDTDATLAANQTIGKLEFYSNDASGAGVGVKASVKALAEDTIGRTSLVFSTADSSSNDTEAMRIDSSGNLLVGTTDVDIGSATSGSGFSYKANNGALQIARQASSATKPALVLNTTGVDSSILDFRKDGADVGIVGTSGGYFFINGGNSGGTHAGLRFINNASIRPCNNVGNDLDATLDLGTANARFEDLYLSGGVYLGGTGSANKLDDYEDGSWTPAIDGLTLTTPYGTYTKIGTLVTAQFTFVVPNNTSTANAVLSGIPFTAASNTAAGRSIGFLTYNPSGTDYTLLLNSGAIGISFRSTTNGGIASRQDLGGEVYWGTLVYRTTQ